VKSIFEDAQKEIYDLMRNDPYVRFCKTAEYVIAYKNIQLKEQLKKEKAAAKAMRKGKDVPKTPGKGSSRIAIPASPKAAKIQLPPPEVQEEEDDDDDDDGEEVAGKGEIELDKIPVKEGQETEKRTSFG